MCPSFLTSSLYDLFVFGFQLPAHTDTIHVSSNLTACVPCVSLVSSTGGTGKQADKLALQVEDLLSRRSAHLSLHFDWVVCLCLCFVCSASSLIKEIVSLYHKFIIILFSMILRRAILGQMTSKPDTDPMVLSNLVSSQRAYQIQQVSNIVLRFNSDILDIYRYYSSLDFHVAPVDTAVFTDKTFVSMNHSYSPHFPEMLELAIQHAKAKAEQENEVQRDKVDLTSKPEDDSNARPASASLATPLLSPPQTAQSLEGNPSVPQTPQHPPAAVPPPHSQPQAPQSSQALQSSVRDDAPGPREPSVESAKTQPVSTPESPSFRLNVYQMLSFFEDCKLIDSLVSRVDITRLLHHSLLSNPDCPSKRKELKMYGIHDPSSIVLPVEFMETIVRVADHFYVHGEHEEHEYLPLPARVKFLFDTKIMPCYRTLLESPVVIPAWRRRVVRAVVDKYIARLRTLFCTHAHKQPKMLTQTSRLSDETMTYRKLLLLLKSKQILSQAGKSFSVTQALEYMVLCGPTGTKTDVSLSKLELATYMETELSFEDFCDVIQIKCTSHTPSCYYRP